MKRGVAVHEVTSEEIMQMLDGELTAERARLVAMHARGCAECRDLEAALREGSEQLAVWTVRDLGQTRQELENLRMRGKGRTRRWRFAALLRPRYAAAICAVILLLTFWAQRSPSRIQVDEQTVRAKLVKTESPDPKYPEEARKSNLQGEVILHIVVARDGSVKKLKVVSGEPVLAKAAAEAVSKWKFQPTVADGKAVEVESDVRVGFKLYP